MAAAVVAAAATVGAEVVGAWVAGTAMTSAFWTTVAAKAAFSAGLSLVAEGLRETPQAPQQPVSQEIQARKELVRASAGPRRGVYGSVGRLSGNLMYIANGTDKSYVHFVIALASHQCQAIGDGYLGDEQVGALDAAGNCIEGRFAGHVRIRKYLGTIDQVMDPDLAAECPEWGAKNRPGKGICYVYLRVKRSRSVFPQGLPTPRFDVVGKCDILDVRTGTRGYTANAALCALDYVLWKRGFASTLDEVFQEDWIAAANICDEDVAIPGGGTQKRYEINGTFTTSRKIVDVLDDMRQAMAGGVNYTMGLWYAYAGAASPAVMDISERDLRGPYRVRPRVTADAVYNAVKGTYTEPTLWTETDFSPVTSAVYQAQDSGRRIYKDVRLAFEIDPYRAQRLAKTDLERHRQERVVELPMRIRGLELRPGNVVRLSLKKLGWVNRLFRVIRWDFNLFGGPDLVLEGYSDAIYTWSSVDADIVEPVPNTTLPNPFHVDPPDALTLSSGTEELVTLGDGTIISRIRAAWPTPVDAFVRRAELRYRVLGATAWLAGPPVPDATVGFDQVGPVVDGAEYEVQIRFENAIGVLSAWSASFLHTVIGKREPPTDPTGFTVMQNGANVIFTVAPCPDKDFGSFLFRRAPRGFAGWDAGINCGEVAGTVPAESGQPRILSTGLIPPGDYTFMCRTFDSTGNPSSGIATYDRTIVNGYTVVTEHEVGPSWAGCNLVNLFRHWTGALAYRGQTPVATQGWETFEPGVADPHPECYIEAPEIDLGFDCPTRVWASWAATSPAISFEVDMRLQAAAYAGFQPWTVGDATARYIKPRLRITTALGQPSLTSFATTADAKKDGYSRDLNIAAGGTAVTFDPPFHFPPELTVKNKSGGALIGAYTDLTATGAIIHLYNTSGFSIGGPGGLEVNGV